VNAENIAKDCALSSIVSLGIDSKRSILADDASSSKNAAKSSNPNSSFKRA